MSTINPNDEQMVLISILENQRNVAMTELARMAARITVLEAAFAQAAAKKEGEERV